MSKNEIKELIREIAKVLFKTAWLIILVVGMFILFTK